MMMMMQKVGSFHRAITLLAGCLLYIISSSATHSNNKHVLAMDKKGHLGELQSLEVENN